MTIHAGVPDDLANTPIEPHRVGSLEHFPDVRSRFLPHAHDVVVCLPPHYEHEPDRSYPVLYLHDGQNVFDDLPMSQIGRAHV